MAENLVSVRIFRQAGAILVGTFQMAPQALTVGATVAVREAGPYFQIQSIVWLPDGEVSINVTP